MKGPLHQGQLSKVLLPMIGAPDGGMGGEGIRRALVLGLVLHSRDCHRAGSFRRSPYIFANSSNTSKNFEPYEVISANIEGLAASNASILSEMCKGEHCHCLCASKKHTDLQHL